MSPAEVHSFSQERLARLYANLPLTLVFNLLLVPLVAWLYRNDQTPAVAYGWALCSLMVLAFRLGLYRAFRRRTDSDVGRWLAWFRLGVCATGLAWGAASLLLLPGSDLLERVTLALILAGIVAGAASSLALDRWSAIGFILPSVVPLAILFALEGSGLAVLMAILILLAPVYLLSSTAQQEHHFRQAESLRLEATARERTLQEQTAKWRVLSRIASELLAARLDHVDQAITGSLGYVGELLGADRAYLFVLIEDGQHVSNTHEWCAPGIEPQMDMLQNQRLEDFAWWWSQIAMGRSIVIEDVSRLPPEAAFEKSTLEAQGIRSTCAFPLIRQGRSFGFIGLDLVRSSNAWARQTVDFLELTAGLIQSALHRIESKRLLAERELQLLHAHRLAALGYWRVDLVKGTLQWSDEVFQLYGRSRIDFEPTLEGIGETVHPEDRAMVESCFRAALQSGHVDVMHRIVRSDGRVRYVHQIGEMQLDKTGTSQCLVGTVQDITERIERERQMLSTRNELEFAVRSAGLGIAQFDLVHGCMTLNEQLLAMAGLSPERRKGRLEDWAQLLHPDDRHLAMDPLMRLRRMAIAGEALVKGGHGPEAGLALDVLVRVRRQDSGEDLWVRSIGVVEESSRDVPVKLMCAMLDVSALVQARVDLESANTVLSLSERRLRGLFELSPIGIALNDYQTGRFIEANDALLAPSGYTREEFLQLSYWELTPGEYQAMEVVQLECMEKTGRFGPYEKEYIRKDGSRYPVHLNGMVVVDPSGRKLIWSMIEDISERKRIERIKSEFVSTVSHELRTPLTAVSGTLALLAGGVLGALDEQAGTMVGVARDNCDRLKLLIDDLLDIERLEAGRMQFNLTACAMLPLIERGMRNGQPYADRYGVRLVLVGAVPDVRVEVDESRFQQVLANLLSNAIKFSPQGEEVQVSATATADRVRVAVADKGPGVPEAFRGSLFQKFVQADASDTREKGGTGLGLAISRQLVEQMGGSIGFESGLEAGAVFWFDLPILAPASEVDPRATGEAPSQGQRC